MSKMKNLGQMARSVRTVLQLQNFKGAANMVGSIEGREVIAINNSVKKVAVIAPHPDDDIFGCGGAIAEHVRAGAEVKVLFLTSGDKGNKEGSEDKNLVSIREKEAIEALECLGKVESTFWRIPDADIAPSKKMAEKLNIFMRLGKFDRIYIPWFGEENADHEQAFQLCTKAITDSPITAEIWQYEVWTPLVPNKILPISSVLDMKKRAIACHKSQLTSRGYADGIIGLNTYRGAMIGLDGPAEAFLVLKPEVLAKI